MPGVGDDRPFNHLLARPWPLPGLRFYGDPSRHPPCPVGPFAGIMGSLQALEVLRILGGMGPALLGRVLIFQGQPVQVHGKNHPIQSPMRGLFRLTSAAISQIN